MSLRPLPASGFVIEDKRTWKAKAAIVDAWKLPSVSLDALDLTRQGAIIKRPRAHAAFKGRSAVLARFHAGFGWQDDDAASRYWIPQGLTGSADSTDDGDDEGKWLAVSWHHEDEPVEKGMRVSFVDVTAWRSPLRYRNVLLVEPTKGDGPGAHSTFAAIPAHAGGAVWFRNYLYVADSRGFDRGKPGGVLVFDMTRIKEVDDSRDDAIGWSRKDGVYHAYGYRYVLPQVGRYEQAAGGTGRPLRWSFIGLDRSGTLRGLMMGEYTTRGQAAARLVWWKLNRRTGRLAVDANGRLRASLARACGGELFLQGCVSHNALAGDGTAWLSRSSSNDALYERPVDGGKGKTSQPWADQPEGLTYAPASDNLWCVTERAGARAVFAVRRGT